MERVAKWLILLSLGNCSKAWLCEINILISDFRNEWLTKSSCCLTRGDVKIDDILLHVHMLYDICLDAVCTVRVAWKDKRNFLTITKVLPVFFLQLLMWHVQISLAYKLLWQVLLLPILFGVLYLPFGSAWFSGNSLVRNLFSLVSLKLSTKYEYLEISNKKLQKPFSWISINYSWMY